MGDGGGGEDIALDGARDGGAEFVRPVVVEQCEQPRRMPRCRSGSAFRLDTALKPWHKREDWLGPSER
jgi:hypothetical protein